MFAHIPGKTSHPVSAHLGGSPIRIVKLHSEWSLSSFANDNQPISSNSEMTVSELACQIPQIQACEILFERIDINVIVPQSLELSKFYFHILETWTVKL